jgi:hypothetical protein
MTVGQIVTMTRKMMLLIRSSSMRISGYALTAAVAIAMLCAPAHGETLTLEQAIQRALAFAPTVA